MGKVTKKIAGVLGGKPKKKSSAPAPVVAAAPASTQPTNVATQDQATLQAAIAEQKKRMLGTVLSDATGGPADTLG